MESPNVIWLRGQNLPINSLGLRQPTGLVVLKRKIKGLLDRESSDGTSLPPALKRSDVLISGTGLRLGD